MNSSLFVKRGRKLGYLGQAMRPGEAYISEKIQHLGGKWRDLRTFPPDISGLRKRIDELDAMKAEVTQYVGEPKASAVNKLIAAAVKRHKEYLAAGRVSASKDRIGGRLSEILGMLASPMVTAPPPVVTPPAPGVMAPVAPPKFDVKGIVIKAGIGVVAGLVIMALLKKLR